MQGLSVTGTSTYIHLSRDNLPVDGVYKVIDAGDRVKWVIIQHGYLAFFNDTGLSMVRKYSDCEFYRSYKLKPCTAELKFFD